MTLKDDMKAYIAPTYSDPRFFDLELSRGNGCLLYNKEDEAYLDLLAGIGVTVLGHNHPEIVQAIHKGAGLLHLSNLFPIENQAEYAKLLASNFPIKKANFFFCNSGAEANAAAIKAASKNKGSFIAAMRGSFHGRYGDGNATTCQPAYNSTRDTKGRWKTIYPHVIELELNNISQIERITNDCFAVIYEPVQIEYGVFPADKRYLEKLRKRCNETGTIMIADEVQTGFGRTGKLFASEYYPDSMPDMITLAKAIANGLPMAAVGFGEKGKRFVAGEHASTFGGGPFVCGVATAVLNTIISERLLDNAGNIQNVFYNYDFGSDAIVEKRGLGFIYGIQLKTELPIKKVIDRCLEKKVIIGPAENNTIRLEPPLVITPGQFKQGLDALKETLDELAN